MSPRNKVGFELGRREINSGIKQRMKKSGVPVRVGTFRGAKISYRLRRKEKRE